MKSDAPAPETPNESDPRFPSGPWTGFFLQKEVPGKHWMELHLTFREGTLAGEGRDRVGLFLVKGRYSVDDGKCHWTKKYVGRHDVFYQGFNEGRGIWGTWEIPPLWKGGFHIWPEGMADPTGQHLSAAADAPASAPPPAPTEAPDEEPIPLGAGAGEEGRGDLDWRQGRGSSARDPDKGS
ncbi:hypothetical protein [Tautonia plasticadhaerens]|uniref:Uncharacterized protein n=1 Tax=Tautonia plasticadhaerens TaxID=2527974 RepID=A0A518GWK3_9BACT|nr:hypothetical protein [Tautonia plasticadhaerens]QDV32974.1 hypothetical protein ElP_08160 [Tautonia plasticadhaerens]